MASFKEAVLSQARVKKGPMCAVGATLATMGKDPKNKALLSDLMELIDDPTIPATVIARQWQAETKQDLAVESIRRHRNRGSFRDGCRCQ